MKQMGVALPDDLRGELERAAEAANVSIAEEIRRRLWSSFVTGVVDVDTVRQKLRYERAYLDGA